MGGLHKGHISLIKKSQNFKGKTLVSIFVNPKQFNEKKDFLNYPRNLKKDLKILKHLNVDLIYLPNLKDIFFFQVKSQRSIGQNENSLTHLRIASHDNATHFCICYSTCRESLSKVGLCIFILEYRTLIVPLRLLSKSSCQHL